MNKILYAIRVALVVLGICRYCFGRYVNNAEEALNNSNTLASAVELNAVTSTQSTCEVYDDDCEACVLEPDCFYCSTNDKCSYHRDVRRRYCDPVKTHFLICPHPAHKKIFFIILPIVIVLVLIKSIFFYCLWKKRSNQAARMRALRITEMDRAIASGGVGRAQNIKGQKKVQGTTSDKFVVHFNPYARF